MANSNEPPMINRVTGILIVTAIFQKEIKINIGVRIDVELIPRFGQMLSTYAVTSFEMLQNRIIIEFAFPYTIDSRVFPS